jgi:hypothetical protein
MKSISSGGPLARLQNTVVEQQGTITALESQVGFSCLLWNEISSVTDCRIYHTYSKTEEVFKGSDYVRL